jgi:RNA polymerase sigma-70 factor (ECF subfamily)
LLWSLDIMDTTAAPSDRSRDSASIQNAPLTPLDAAMDRYADGDDTAFNELASGLRPRLVSFLFRLAGSRDLAEDLAQESLVRIHRARASFVRGRPVVPWAHAIARNCLIGHLRVARAHESLNVELPTGPDTNAESTVAARQSAYIVTKALAAMPAGSREAFVLLRYEGLSVATAAQIVGVSNAALKLRAFRAYEALRAALRKSDAWCRYPSS